MDVANIFRSRTRKALFRLYFTNPDNEYYLRELERILGIPVSMIRKELQKLERVGFFKSRKRGNLTYFYLDRSYHLFDELKSIVFKTIGASGALKKEISKLKGIRAAFIYGSFAKGDEHSDSDIDLCIIGSPSEKTLIGVIRKLEEVTKREINYTIYDPDDFNNKKKEKGAFVYNIMNENKVFLVGSQDDI